MDRLTRKIFQTNLGRLADAHKLSQSQIAAKSGLPKDRISYYFNGGAPQGPKLEALARAFNVSPEYLITDHGEVDAVPLPEIFHFATQAGSQPGTTMVRFAALLPNKFADQITNIARKHALNAEG